jgi:hypothetical protein
VLQTSDSETEEAVPLLQSSVVVEGADDTVVPLAVPHVPFVGPVEIGAKQESVVPPFNPEHVQIYLGVINLVQ